MSTPTQENAHKANIVAAESARQTALAAARLAFNGGPSGQAGYDAAIKAADSAHMRAILASATLNGFAGPTQSLYWLTYSYT